MDDPGLADNLLKLLAAHRLGTQPYERPAVLGWRPAIPADAEWMNATQRPQVRSASLRRSVLMAGCLPWAAGIEFRVPLPCKLSKLVCGRVMESEIKTHKSCVCR